MGDTQDEVLRVDFDRQIKLELHGSTVTSDAGLLAYRELDDALGLTSTAASRLYDARSGQNNQHSLLALLRQSIYSRLAGYEDVNDAERLCLDPALRTVVGGRAKGTQAASTSEMTRFETAVLSTKEDLKHLMDLSGRWIDQAHQHRKLTKLVLDMDSSVSETYGRQQGSAYNGYFGGAACSCQKVELVPSAGQRLQRLFRLYLLPPAVPLQTVRRPGAHLAAPGQLRQRQVLAAGAAAR